MKFHDHRWITESDIDQKLFSITNAPMTLNFDLLTPKSIGYILDSWGARV